MDTKVVVRRKSLPHGEMGHCIKRTDGSFSITVSNFKNWTREELVEELQNQILIHEYSHVLSWDRGSAKTSHHGVFFAAGYHQAYSSVFPPEE